MRRILVIAVAVCSLLWAVSGVSVLVIAFHEHLHHHNHAETHNHDDVFELVLHCHDNDDSPHHDHELTAQLSASRTSWSVHVYSLVSQANDFLDSEVGIRREADMDSTESNDHGPPVFLLNCVLLT